MIIDPASPVGKVRLRIGDWQDLPILPDSVINSALTDCQASVPRAAALCAQYVLATLTSSTHRKLDQFETWGADHFNNYLQFLKTTVLNPNLMSIAPVPYIGTGDRAGEHPLIAFTREWNLNYAGITLDQQLAMDAIGFTVGQL